MTNIRAASLPVFLTLLAAALPTGAGAQAEEAPGCPTVEGRGVPLELRVGDLVLRVQVSADEDAIAGTRVEARVVGCERDRLIPTTPAEPDADADAAEALGARTGVDALMRVLHDLRIGLELGPARDGDCVRARLEVEDAAGGAARAAATRPVDVQLCGLPGSPPR